MTYVPALKIVGTLLTILNDILDFSKIESRKLELEGAPFSIHMVIADVLKPLALRASQKGLELICDIDPHVSVGVVGDSTRIQQILTNWWATRLNSRWPCGYVVFGLTPGANVDCRTALHFSVTDMGIGIPKEQQTPIFRPFDRRTDRRRAGSARPVSA